MSTTIELNKKGISSERIKELESCFSILEADILYYKRPPSPTVQEIRFLYSHVDTYFKEKHIRKIIVDMRYTALPSVKTRKLTRQLTQSIKPNLDHVVLIIPNSLFRVSISFIFKNLIKNAIISTATSLDETLLILQKKNS